MDVELARTFLAIVETGSFIGAAARVHVTQSTVSMRIKALEDQLGRTLFERNKSGASLTPAGARFEKHALAMVRIWEHARLEVALPEGYRTVLAVGGQFSLCDGFLLDWLARMRVKAQDIAIRLQAGFSDVLMQWLSDGSLDLGVMYTPQRRPGFEVELLFEEELVLVSSEPRPAKQPGRNYVYIDWGPEFRADHSLNFPQLTAPGASLEIGSLGLRYLLENRASGYLPMRLVKRYLDDGTFRLVLPAPRFSYPVYAVYSADADAEILGLALRNLRKIAAAHISD